MTGEQFSAALDAASARGLVTLAHFLWQGSAVALAVGLALVCLRRRSASVRYGVAVAGLALMAVCPVGTYWYVGPPAAVVSPVVAEAGSIPPTPGVSVPTVPAPALEPGPVSAPADLGTGSAVPTPAEPRPAAVEATRPRWVSAAAVAYFAGVVLLLVRLALGLRGGRRLCRQAEPVSDPGILAALQRQVRSLGLRAAPVVAVCRQVAVPTVVGILRPTILLPISVATGLAPHQLEAILAHELAHLRRYDHLVNLLQRLVEAFLFFHPAVWWLSRQVRLEREHCCDDLVVSAGATPATYAASLLRVAELALAVRPVLAVEGLTAVRTPSALRRRVARLLGAQEPPLRLMRAWPVLAVAAVAALVFVPYFPSLGAKTMTGRAGTEELAAEPSWGDAAGGLQVGIVAVAADTDEQKPDVAKTPTAAAFAHAEDVTLLVQLKNVTDKRIVVQGTRYGDSVSPPSEGKSATDHFASFIFDSEFLDKDGKPLDVPTRSRIDTDVMLSSSGGLAEAIEPGQSLTCLVHPARWSASAARLLVPGEYQVRLRYRGPTPAALAGIKKHWPGKPMADAWTGDAPSGRVSFTVADAPENRRPEPTWGAPVNGLRAAAELRSSARTPQAWRDTAANTYPFGTPLQVDLLVKNVSDKDVSLWSESWRQEDRVFVTDPSGKETELKHPWYSGWAMVDKWTLKPGQVVVLPAIPIGAAPEGAGDKAFEHPIGAVVSGKPGQYRLRFEMRFNGWQRTEDGKPVPGKDDFQGTLTTGATTITVRERKAEDEPPTFTARLRFQSPDGKPVVTGHVEVRVPGSRPLVSGELTPGAFEVPKCPVATVAVDVRAPGFEETHFYEVPVEAGKEAVLTLTPAQPLRFRLATRDGRPVAGAKVHYFVRGKMDASAGPYPPHGLTGPVWATSNAEGEVVVDCLQKFDPIDRKLGNNIYWFYVEPPGLAPFFVGPVQAGEDLGKLTVSPLLEVRGEVSGTPAELAAFAAEWDQPAPMKRGNGEVGWYYAESKRLETQRVGDKLTFHVTGLGAGPFRIVSRFKTGGKPVSHEFSRRSPNEDDVVFQVDLTESRNDLVIDSTGNQPKKP